MSQTHRAIRKAALVGVGATAVACVVGPQQHPQPVAGTPAHVSVSATAGAVRDGASGAVLPDGPYACNLENGGHVYPTYLCTVATKDGRTRLEKFGGSQRIRGDVTVTGPNSFRLSGEFYCPSGACTTAITADFSNLGRQQYRGTFEAQGAATSLWLRYLPEDPDAYGSDMYGGGAYGGGAYGADMSRQ